MTIETNNLNDLSDPLLISIIQNITDRKSLLDLRSVSKNFHRIISDCFLHEILPLQNTSPEIQKRVVNWALQNSRTQFICSLKEKGIIDLNKQNIRENEYFYTYLEDNIIKGHRQAIKTLIEAGADLNNQNNTCRSTPLILASSFENRKEIAYDLIQSGADVNLQDVNGFTALMHAVSLENIQSVRQLLQAGANPNIQDNQGHTVLMKSAFLRNRPITLLLIEAKAHLNIQDAEGDTALMCAILSKNKQIASDLIDAGADVNIQDIKGNTALMKCAGKKHLTEMIQFLIPKGADLKIKNQRGQTALDILKDGLLKIVRSATSLRD